MSMTYAEIFTMISGIGLPAAYNHFPEGTAMAPPFICFYYPSSDDFLADNTEYVKREQLYIELYTAEKDFTTEQAVEAALREKELNYTRTETYLDSEKLYMELYTTEVYIDG